MKTTKYTTGRKQSDHGLSDAEREARFAAHTVAVKGRLDGRARPAPQHGPSTPAIDQARALGLKKRVARVRPSA